MKKIIVRRCFNWVDECSEGNNGHIHTECAFKATGIKLIEGTQNDYRVLNNGKIVGWIYDVDMVEERWGIELQR
jgi:hypothetical protein